MAAAVFHAPQVKNNREVNKWLTEMRTIQPLLNEWYLPDMKIDDPVEQLYGGYNQYEEKDLMVWVIVVLVSTMCIVFIITFICHGYICGWETYHGSPCLFPWKRNKITTGNKDCNNYERPSDARPQEIHVYQDGRKFSESCAVTLDETEASDKKEKGESEKESIFDFPKNTVLKVGFQMRRSLISRLSTRRESHKRRRLRSMPYIAEKNEAIPMTHTSRFSDEPLPPIPNLRLKRAEAMMAAHKIKHTNTKSFEEVKKELLSNSFDTLYKQSTSSRQFNLFRPYQHNIINRTISNQNAIRTKPRKPLRSMSLDDDFLLNTNKKQNRIMRHSKSLDILEENVTINTLYEEIKDKQATGTKKEIFGYVEIDTNDIMKFANKNKMVVNNHSGVKERPDNSYTKVDDLNSMICERKATVSDIQNRPLPRPEEGKIRNEEGKIRYEEGKIQNESKVKQHEHLYCRASLLISEKNNS